MAGSRTFTNKCNGNWGSHYTQNLIVNWGDGDTANNRTYVWINYSRTRESSSYYNYGYANPSQISIDGGQVASATPYSAHNQYATQTLCTWEGWIYHNNNGEKTINVSASFSSTSPDLSGGSVGGTITLPTIPREAKITVAPNFNDEENPTITFTNPGGFRINARLEFGGVNIQRDNIANTGNYTFELTNEERNLLRSKTPNSNNLTVRYVIATYINSDVENYWNWHDRTMTIINANPVFNDFDFEDINPTTLALTGNSKINVNGYSNVRVSISTLNKAEALKYATMSKYRFVIDNQTVDIAYKDDETVRGTINNSTSGVYNVYAIDSRGNTKQVTKASTAVKQYTPITLNPLSCKVERDNNGVGTNAILTLQGNIWNENFGQVNNTVQSITYQFKKTNSSTWITGTTTITPTINNDGTFTFTGLIGSDNADYSWDIQSSYDFIIMATDKLSSTSLQLTPMASGTPHISFADDGVGIMCDYDETIGGLLQVGGQRIV